MVFPVRLIVLLLPLLQLAALGSSVAQERTAEASDTDVFEGYQLVRIWTVRDGLPNNLVTSLAQTEDGFFVDWNAGWFGTV